MVVKVINKNRGGCFSCKSIQDKKDFIKHKSTYICKKCWYYNSESIFKEYKEVENQQLIFWKHTIVKGKVKI